MYKKLLFFACMAFSVLKTQAAYVPVAVTGYNADVVANGAGPSAISAPQDVDGVNYAFMAPDFNPSGTIFPTSFLPASGLVTSAVGTTPGLTYQLASYSANNSLRLSGTASGTLTFTTPTAAGEVYVLATGGSGPCTATITVTFSDATTQVFNSQAIPDWYGGTNFAIQGLGRVDKTTNGIDNNTTNPRLYQLRLALNATNFARQITSITFANTGAVLNVMGISINTPCSGAPVAGATASSAGAAACSGVNFNLTLPTATSGVGITYQWQSSATGSAPWTTIAAATGATYTASQTATTTYRAYVSCSGGTADTSTPITVGMKAANQCYCVPVATSASYYISSFVTTGGTTNINNSGTGAGITSLGYSDYSGTISASGMQASTINFTAASNSNPGIKVFVDWNQDGDFTGTGELVYTSNGYATSFAGSFTIPANAVAGPTRLRIRSDWNSTTGPAGPCGSVASSEAEDYAFNVIPLPSCTGTPTAGTTSVSASFICPTEQLTLSSTGGNFTGLTNQWQSSIDGGVTWVDIAGATINPYTFTGQTVTTQYRNKQVCTITSSPDVFSSTVTVGARNCYCNPSFASGCTTWRLTNVTFGTINNSPTACATSNYTAMSTTVTAAVAFPMSITTNQFAAASVYIDLNNDGDFDDADEWLYTEPYSGAATSTATPNITIPGYVPAGPYRFRVICKWGGGTGAGQACTAWPTNNYGNFHDYTLNVLAAQPCVAPTAQPTALTLAASATIANVSFTAPTPAADRYLVIRTPGTAAVTAQPQNNTDYLVGATIGNGVVVSHSNAVSFQNTGLTPGTTYTYTVFANNSLCFGGPLYNTAAPITGTVTTAALGIYTWNGSVNNNWTVPANWTPTRSIVDPSDVMQFNNGIVDTANSIPNEAIRRLVITANTTVYLKAAATNTLTIGDTVAATADLSIASGSALYSNGTTPLTIAFTGANNTVTIAGRMESVSNAVNNIFDFTNTTATVASTGVLSAGGSNANQAIVGTTATNLQVNGLYDYKYTTNTVAIPVASWNTGSTLLISGYTTVTGGPNGGQNQAFYNLTYDCANQTSAANWSGTGALNVANNLTVANTGTGSWIYASTQAYNGQVKNFIQTGGTFNLASASATTSQVFNVSGNFTKSGGTLTAGGTTAASQPTINFNGTAAQTASFNASPTGQFVYRFSNPAGVNLVGTSGLTTFNINNNGGVRITTTAANPVTTTMALAYGTTNTTLYYDTAGSYTMTANVFPTTAGPQNLNIALGNSGNVVTMPFSRTIPGTLTMASGDVNIGANILTLGTAPAAAGTLTYTAGNIRVTTGSMVRWFNVTGAPTTVANTGLYPIAYGSISRAVNVYFSTATALSTGGTIGVGHTNATGFTTVAITDGAYNVTQRTNSFWSFTTGNGIATTATGTIGARVSGNGLLIPTVPADLRMVQAAAVVGTHVAGSAPVNAQRTGLTIADLASPYYIGSAATNITGVYVAVNSGPWSVGATWDIGTAPGITNDAYINSGVVVTSDAATNAAKSLNILPGGTLTSTTGTVTIDSALQNNGTVNLTGGTLIVNGNSGLSGITNSVGALFNHVSGTTRVGPVNGGNKTFTNAGILTVGGGTLNINGSLALSANSTFNQSGGNINVDGNAGNILANSVGAGTPIVNILTPNLNLTAGNFTIVDPHLAASTNTFVYNVTTTHANAGGTHTFVIGNGTSTDTGFNAAYGFSVNTNVGSGRFAFRNVIVNAGAAANSWLVLGAGSTGVLGNFTVNATAEYRQGGTGTILYIAGNLVNNGTYSALGTTYFGNYISGAISSALTAQTVSGTGIFRNQISATPTAKFYKIQVNNNANVTFNIGDIPFSNNVTFTAAAAGPSRIIMPGTSTLMELAGAGVTGNSQAAGWVVGRYQKAAAVGGMNHNFPIGDLNYYAPVNVSGTAVTAGAIWASTTGTDHPNLGTSTINPLATVNRYYTIDTNSGLTFGTNAMTTTYNWNAADLDANTTPASFVVGKYRAASWSYPVVNTPTATSIKSTTAIGEVTGQFAIGESCSAITITAQPVNTTACVGNAVTFKVSTTPKAGVTYQWRKGTTNITGATDSVYTIPAVVAGDAGNYNVVVSSGCGSITSVTSATAALTINLPATITTQPTATRDICEGSPVTFTVAATGTNITYQWRKAGAVITGATNASYTIPVVAPGDAASYTVDVIGSSPCGSVTSAASVLTVKTLPLTITAATTTSFCTGGSVVLNAPTTPATLTYQWQNGGGNITGQTNNSYTATTSGSYTAVITNTANGCSNSSNIIVVSATGAPQAIISPAGTASFCQGTSVKLSGNNTAGLTYEWFRNGGTTAVGLDSTLIVTAPGSYTLKVSIGAGCSTISTATVVTETPLPVITTTPAGPNTICQGDTLSLLANFTGATLVWKLNGSPVVPAATGATYKATAAGSYTVTATSTSTGCVNTSAAVAVSVNALPTVSIVSVNAATFCEGGSDTLRANPATGLTYVWNRNASPVTPSATGVTYVATQTGSYTVTATSTTTGCSRTSAVQTVTANPLPSVVITPSLPLAMCTGQTNNLCIPTTAGTTYQWKNGTANITGATAACYAATAAGTYSVTAITTATGCTATSSAATISVNPTPTATITNTGTAIACAGDTVCLNANTDPGLTYQWRVNSGNIPGATNATYCATSAGNYTVVVTNGSNCSATSAILNMAFNPRPSASISYTTPVTFCEGGAVVLTGVSNTGTTYQWQNNGAPISGATSNNFIASATGSYSVIITAPNGCASTTTATLVVVNPLPSPVITRNGNILSTGNYARYQWYFNSSPIPGATNQSYNVTQNGGYAVYVTDFNNCTNYSGIEFFNNVSVGGPLMNAAAIKIFPNPVRSVMNIDAPAPVNVVVRDVTGTQVMKLENAKQMDMSQLANGMYMLMISDKNGNMVKMEKVLKVSE